MGVVNDGIALANLVADGVVDFKDDKSLALAHKGTTDDEDLRQDAQERLKAKVAGLEFKPFEAVDGLMTGRSLQKMIADIKKVTTEEALKEKHA